MNASNVRREAATAAVTRVPLHRLGAPVHAALDLVRHTVRYQDAITRGRGAFEVVADVAQWLGIEPPLAEGVLSGRLNVQFDEDELLIQRGSLAS